MRDDFAVFILTHGRPDRVHTIKALRSSGYTGKLFLVIDDEDKAGGEYRKRFGDAVLQFSKAQIAQTFDEGDNFEDRRAIIYARNACFDLARQVGVRYFMQLDDDYTGFFHKFNHRREFGQWRIKSLDRVLEAMIEFLAASPALSIAMAQGGDHLGGGAGTYAQTIATKRKAMNTFLCDVERPFQFVGRINEDVNTYTLGGRRGELFLTILGLMIIQKQTQSNAGGMTELYLDSGTYLKSFYSIMYCPSSVKIAAMGEVHRRLHHRVDWPKTAVQIIPESCRKARAT